MSNIKYTFQVLQPRVHQTISIWEDILWEIPNILSTGQYDKYIFISDHYFSQYNKPIISYFEKLWNAIIINSKSHQKDWLSTEMLIKKFQENGLTRKSCIVWVWGGLIGDLVGFTASIYMRGVDFIFIPTTLMSQSDSVIWKLAVNFWWKKNLVWTFSSPKYTLCDINFLKSNSETMIFEGLIEIWKTGLIDMNKEILSNLDRYLESMDNKVLIELIYKSLTIKAKYVSQDFYDLNGQHKALSLGHTFSNYFEEVIPNLSHGSGVLYGILLASVISFKLGLINDVKYKDILNMSLKFLPKLKSWEIVESLSFERMKSFFLSDKISSHWKINFVLLTENGFTVYKDTPDNVIQEAITILKSIISSNL